ncbi:MAG TPA: hypothetical protein VH479_21640 [Acidimicrobiales bacterium]|jgi:hypothetical protein
MLSALRKLRDDRSVVDGLVAFHTAPLWFEPLPRDDAYTYQEATRFEYAPTLDERLARVQALIGPAAAD